MTAQQYNYIVGIIPAYAGNTVAQYASMAVTGDHPRICGEHLTFS